MGVDYFGPLEVRSGHAKVKRYGALLTCSTVRAVNIEVAHSLDTDLCINALQHFQLKEDKHQLSILTTAQTLSLLSERCERY